MLSTAIQGITRFNTAMPRSVAQKFSAPFQSITRSIEAVGAASQPDSMHVHGFASVSKVSEKDQERHLQ